MSDQVFALVSTYGPIIIFISTLLSCLLMPVPSSLMMLAGGAFAASEDLVLWQVMLAAYVGAVLGDQAGYRIGRKGGQRLTDWVHRKPTRSAAMIRAERMVDRHGSVGVFFSRWAVAPLGPWVNLIAGITGMPAGRFTLWDMLGEAVWVTMYVALGYVFASQLATVADVMGNIVGLLAGATAAIVLGLWLRGALRRARAEGRGPHLPRRKDRTIS